MAQEAVTRPSAFRWSFLFIAILCLIQVPCAGQHVKLKKSHPVPYCMMVENPHRYDHSILLVHAIYTRGGEVTSLYDPSCNKAGGASWLEYSKNLPHTTSSSTLAALDRQLDTKGRAEIDALVEFYGPKTIKVPKGTSDGLAALMRGTDSKYGHANQFATKVILLKVVSSAPVSTDVPWPR
jgi:hypothetical protein